MGIETALLGGLALAGKLLKPVMPPPPPNPAAPPQASKAPNAQGIKRQNAEAEAAGGANNTLLTGPGGISTDLLNLGKNTLLGA